MGSDETASLARPKCPNCDTIAPLGARFCSNCGTRLDAGDSVATEATGAMTELPTDEPFTGGIATVPDRPDSGAVLVIRKGPYEGTRFTLNSDVVRIGRSPDSDVFLDDITVSRNHAEVLHIGTGWKVRDKGSLNGTYVNRSRVDEATLDEGDEVQIGKYRFMFWAAE